MLSLAFLIQDEDIAHDTQFYIDLAKEWGINAGLALITFFVGWWLAKAIRGILRKVLDKRGIDSTLSSFLSSISYMAMLTMVVVAAIDQLGVHTTSFVAILGAAGLAVGFALQGSLSNFASGVMIIFFRPFKAGDFVDAAGISGVVEEVTIFATRMHTPDNKVITIPNGQIPLARVFFACLLRAFFLAMLRSLTMGGWIRPQRAIRHHLPAT